MAHRYPTKCTRSKRAHERVDDTLVKEMCTGCANQITTRCQVNTEPIYFWRKYGKCPFKVIADIPVPLQDYSPDIFRWFKTKQELREEGLIS